MTPAVGDGECVVVEVLCVRAKVDLCTVGWIAYIETSVVVMPRCVEDHY